MENNSLTDIVKSRREAGEGVFSSLGGAAKERLKERLDWKRMLPQGGLLTALFPKLKAYKAQKAASPTEKVLKNIDTDFALFAKNSKKLESIANNFLLMKREVNKLAKLEKITPATSVDKSIDSENTSVDTTQPSKIETIKDGFNIFLLIAAIAAIGAAITLGIDKLKESYESGIKNLENSIGNLTGDLYDKIKESFTESDLSKTFEELNTENLKKDIIESFNSIWVSLNSGELFKKIKDYSEGKKIITSSSGPVTVSYPSDEGEKSSTTPKSYRESIGGHESGGSYDTVYGKAGGAKINGKSITENTIDEVSAWQASEMAAGTNRHAAGKYQFMNVSSIAKQAGLKGSDLFDADNQEKMMDALTEENAKILRKNNIPDTPEYLSMAHAVGAGGTVSLINAQKEGKGGANALNVLNLRGEQAKTNPHLNKSVDEAIAMLMARGKGTVTPPSAPTKVANKVPSVTGNTTSSTKPTAIPKDESGSFAALNGFPTWSSSMKSDNRPGVKNGEMEDVQGAVIHHTGGDSLSGAVSTLISRGLSYHYLIDKDGSIVQLIPGKHIGYHTNDATQGQMRGKIGNFNTFGISLVAADDSKVTPQQVASTEILNNYLSSSYGYNPKNVWGHGEIQNLNREGDTAVAAIRGPIPIQYEASQKNIVPRAVASSPKNKNIAYSDPSRIASSTGNKKSNNEKSDKTETNVYPYLLSRLVNNSGFSG